ncbi:MAG: monooxygenase, partial [Acidimicrobiaceae bacterium]
MSAFESAGINILCGQDPFKPVPSLTSRCDKVLTSDFTIIAAAAHMHLLGRTLSLTLNPGTASEKTILDVKNYNFDDQSGTVLKTPVKVKAGDTIRVTCSFDPTLRQKLPELQKLPPRY